MVNGSEYNKGNHPVLVIGAGIAGLTAATYLQQAGLPVLLLDKGRGVGGRMATRRFANGRFDHGAQYFTARQGQFRRWVAEWEQAGIVSTWSYGFPEGDRQPSKGHPRYRGRTGMTAVPKYLAQDLDVRLQTHITAVSGEDGAWLAQAETGETFSGRALLLTPPVPQSLALLQASDFTLPAQEKAELQRVAYNPCLALMASFAAPSRLPAPGGLRLSQGKITWIADNYQKGISPGAYAVTIHASPTYSQNQWHSDAGQIAHELLAEASNWLPGEPTAWQLHRWRYAQPVDLYPEPVLFLPGPPPLAFAGDAFGGPRVEGAAVSGYAAARAMIDA